MVPAGPPHAAVLAELQAACFPDEPWSAVSIAGMVEPPAAFAVIAMEGGEPAGFVMVRTAGEDGEILAIGVLDHARGRGTGRRLVDAAVAGAMRRGATAVFLEVAEDNAAARALYSRAGFVPVGRRPGYYRRRDGRVAALVLRFPSPPMEPPAGR
nr:GNAT family N-acetyltransferase [Azospirillum oleiclasticum]